MDAGQIKVLLAARAEELCQLLLPGGQRKGRNWNAGSIAGEPGKSLAVFIEGDRSGQWTDFATGEHGDLIDLWQKSRGVDFITAKKELLRWLNLPNDFVPRAAAIRNRIAAPQKATSFAWAEVQRSMRLGRPEDLAALAELRKIPSVAGLQLASNAGQLYFGDVFDDGARHPAWIVTDCTRKTGQARRMDGHMWVGIGAKSKTIAGCESKWPIGITDAAAFPEIALVEGEPDFLAAWYFIWLADKVDSIRPVAMFGAGKPIHEEALPMFKGKTIWLHPHNDKGAGQAAVVRWSAQLRQAGAAEIEPMDFGIGMVKDLCDVAAGGLSA